MEKNLSLQRVSPRARTRRSISNCLVALGATVREVYACPGQHGGRGQWLANGGSIWHRFDDWEIEDWIDRLYLKRVKMVHHDLIGNHIPMRDANEAREVARTILANRKKH